MSGHRLKEKKKYIHSFWEISDHYESWPMLPGKNMGFMGSWHKQRKQTVKGITGK